MDDIILHNHSIKIKKSRSARRFSLRIDPQGKLKMTVPWYTLRRDISIFLSQHADWIDKNIKKIEKVKKLRPAPKYLPGDVFYYFGEKLRLEVLPRDKIRPVIKVCDDRMIVSLNKNSTLKDGTFAIRKAIDIFYRRKAEEVIYDRLEFFNEHYNFKYNRVTLRDQKTRWGSCSSASNLNFNWRLIMAPIEVIDYVVVHELCHLREMNHSGNYWRLVEETIPDHKKMRKWLKDYQYLLMF